MNLRDIYEKEEENVSTNPQAIDIKDPKMQYLVKKARNKYAYAKTDLEAFVKFMQDEVQDVEHEVQDVENDVQDVEKINTKQQIDIEHESEINNAQQKEIDSTEASAQKSKEVNIAQQKHLTRLDAKETELDIKIAHFDKAEKRMDMMIDKFDKATLRHNETVQIGN